MRPETNLKEKLKMYRSLILFGLLIFYGLQNIPMLWNIFMRILSILTPFFIGGGFAFVMNILVNKIEELLGYTSLRQSLKRTISVIGALLVFFLVIACFLFVVIPHISASIENIIRTLPSAANDFVNWLTRLAQDNPRLLSIVESASISGLTELNYEDIITNLSNWLLSGGAGNIFATTVNLISTTVSWAVTFIVAFVFAILTLFNKERLIVGGKKLLHVYTSEKVYHRTLYVLNLTKTTFTNYIGGSCTECLILGSLVTIGGVILKIQYAFLGGVIVGVTALVPMFGAFCGCLITAVFIAMVDPMQALYFIIMVICIQQVEGNLIYPHVVGNSVGLPALYVIVAISIGGSLMGIVGMIIFIPICSIFYTLLKTDVNERIARAQKKPESAEAAQ